ncbi:MAG: T9SS type A sorting domain-containing protein [Aureispira sp.]|nr:T9SS type A sorting domain-containing protein [Aureispira sp.]
MKKIYTILLFSLLYTSIQAQTPCPAVPQSAPCDSCCYTCVRDYYWVGVNGAGDYEDPTNWHLDSLNGPAACRPPFTRDNVYFMAGAFTVAPAVININGSTPATCHDMYWDDNITTAQDVTFQSTSTMENALDIYGSLTLAHKDSMSFEFRGKIRFLSTDTLATIQLQETQLNVFRVVFNGSDSTEFRLLDDLKIRNWSGNTGGYDYTRHGGFLRLFNGYFNSNANDLDVVHFWSLYESDSTSACRGLNISNSTVRVYGYRQAWRIDFDTTSVANFCYFDATGSHIIVDQTFPFNNRLYFGNGLTYDSLSVSSPHATLYMYNSTWNYCNLEGSANFPSTNIQIRELYLQGGQLYGGGNSNLTVGSIDVLGGCGNLARVDYFANITKLTSGLLSFSNTILSRITFDLTGGRTYQADNSLDKGNVVNCTINGAIGRDLYFVDNDNDQNWHNPNNWFRDSLGFRVPVYCIPTVFDNAFFYAGSFPNFDKFVYANAAVYCHDMRWLSTVADSAYLQLGKSTVDYTSIYLYGTIELSENMKYKAINSGGTHPNTHNMYLYGKKDSIIANGKYINVVILDQTPNTDYTIIGDMRANFMDVDGILRSKNNALVFNSLILSKRYLDSVQVYLYAPYYTHRNYAFGDRGSFDVDSSYTGNTTFHLIRTSGSWLNGGGHYPNVISHVPLRVYDSNNKYYIHGNLTLLEDADIPSYMDVLGDQKILSGGQPYNGDFNLTSGKSYTLLDVNTQAIYIQNAMTAKGSCQEQILIQHEANGLVDFDFNEPDSVDLAFVYMNGLNNISGTTIDAFNCIDAGNNSNWNFTSGAGQVFYWRANLSAPTDFEGSWQDANHWTTIVGNTIGDGGCIPGPLDTVVFDAMSFSPTSNGCTVSGNAFCKTLICQDAIHIYGNTGKWYINESMHLHNAMQMGFSNNIYFVGSGVVESDNVAIQARGLYFQNATGSWDILDEFKLESDSSNRHGMLYLVSGTLNTNGHTINIDNRFVATGTQPRTLNLDNSTIEIHDKGYYDHSGEWVWDIQNPANMTLNAGTSTVIVHDNQDKVGLRTRRFYMGDGLEYNHVYIYPTELCYLYGSATYDYLKMYGTMDVHGNNTCDSIYFEGSRSYNFAGGTTQTLKSPYGKIISNGSLSNYINIQTFPSGQKSYFHKEYGKAFCVDFLKVQDNEATKGIAPALTVWDTLHQFLAFQTGVNSDNIGGTATGIWEFNLPPLMLPTAGGDTTINLCTSGNSSFPIKLRGTAPYLISGTWSDGVGGNGTIKDTIIYDNDGNQNTPLSYNVEINSSNSSVTYVLNITTYRCGEERIANPVTIQVNRPTPSPLVQVQRNSACYLDNQDNWRTFVDDVDERPILSINDYTGAGDNDSLKNVMVSVDFDATTQYWNGYPYLVRNWTVTPENNTGAQVRLYFTQEELDTLHAHTASPTPLNPASDIVVIKFASGVVGLGPGVVVPHTALTWNPSKSAPLSTTTDIVAVEYSVTSFSAFIIIPYAALLPNEFIAFEAQANEDRTIALDWTIENDQNSRSFVVERSINGINFEAIGELIAYSNGENTNNYSFLDESPNTGTNYYRIQQDKWTGEFGFSSIQAVYLDGVSLFQIYPNPVSNQQLNIRLQTEQEREWTMMILDQLGRVVRVHSFASGGSVQNHSIALGKIASGIYILRMTNDKGQELRRKFYVK